MGDVASNMLKGTSEGELGMSYRKPSATFFSIFLMAALAGAYLIAHVATANSIPSGWSVHSINNQVSFAYPANFVEANDGSPNVQIAGGALLDSTKTKYELLLGVEINHTPDITVDKESSRLIQSYGKNNLVIDNPTSLGQELEFHLSGNSTYTIILAPLTNGLREILINNENSSPQYDSIIQMFLSTIHNTTANAT